VGSFLYFRGGDFFHGISIHFLILRMMGKLIIKNFSAIK